MPMCIFKAVAVENDSDLAGRYAQGRENVSERASCHQLRQPSGHNELGCSRSMARHATGNNVLNRSKFTKAIPSLQVSTSCDKTPQIHQHHEPWIGLGKTLQKCLASGFHFPIAMNAGYLSGLGLPFGGAQPTYTSSRTKDMYTHTHAKTGCFFFPPPSLARLADAPSLS